VMKCKILIVDTTMVGGSECEFCSASFVVAAIVVVVVVVVALRCVAWRLFSKHASARNFSLAVRS